MFSAAVTIQTLMIMTSLWTITLHSIASRVDAVVFATGIHSC